MIRLGSDHIDAPVRHQHCLTSRQGPPQGILASSMHPPDCPIINGATLPIFGVFIIGIPTSHGDFPG
ncbi:hypothetical protein B0H14DRAFT_2365282 [Mycena olivaceomarginata]|nr:hypothetical protein B0H14DRAFT_2365282 [Mycena olivaceomarginata]